MTIKEATEYSNIEINRIEELRKTLNYRFVMYVGTKKLVMHREFDKFLSDTVEINCDKKLNFPLNVIKCSKHKHR